ncbi:HlyD family type I secretion periplasmic adaptor subunit [Roseomonas eburnea]|uniref:Membrane fusion protein (MFP) family protein n=1 Tax=Neoroseomonas eburnea TaxID=1346889 RepID=A0A9X9XFW5_9PROT|nr:HlyD family type I secretion periplasmic adaptor subunit [Neoroseomonas eburnea]MBR0682601.1 HlyD family type I secretion periplasmic adaptor subunit [Neoroseomonas eburnea]
MSGRRSLARRRASPPTPRLAPEALPFQDPLEALIAEPPPPFLRGLYWLVAALFVALLAVATLAEVDVVVTGAGRLAPDAPPIVLQPMERAVIREIRVRPGDVVRRGQVLAVLDPAFAEADRAALAAQRRALASLLARLEAELADLPAPPGEDRDSALQAGLHARRQAFLAARLRALEEEMRGQQAAILTLEEAEAASAEQIAIARDVEALRARLLEGQIGSRLHYLEARARRIAAEQQRDQDRGRLRELRHALEQKRAERQGFLDDWRRQVIEEVARVRGELSRVEESLAKATRLAELTLVTAPEDGTVLEVARRSAGSVLREAEPLISLVPAAAPLIAEVALRSADIGQVRAGDPAVIKVDAFPFQRHGTLAGRLRAVAQESQAPRPGGEGEPGQAAGGPLHRAQVELDATGLRHPPEGARPIAGMTVTAEIRVGSRSVLSYFLFPLIRGVQESLREP